MPIARSGGAPIYYELHGEGPALVLIHGSGGNHAIWWQQVPHFANRFTVVTVDLPGFGKSVLDFEDFDNQHHPAAIIAAMDHAGIDRAFLLGQSLGGTPTLMLAVTRPDRVSGVALAHSIGGISDPAIASLVRADRERSLSLNVVDRLLSRHFQDKEPEKLHLFFQLGGFNQATSELVRKTLNGRISLDQVRRAIAGGVSIAFLQGTADAVVGGATYDRLRILLPQAHIETVSGACHSDYWETPQAFNAAIDRILESATWNGRT